MITACTIIAEEMEDKIRVMYDGWPHGQAIRKIDVGIK
ncbi:hypothetical protein F444_19403, partial [Phytophthora nicotianae P1976]